MANEEYYRKLIASKQEKLEKYREFERLVSQLADYTTEIGQHLDMMTSGTQGVKEILENWELVLQSVSLASSGLLNYGIKDIEEGKAKPEPLVRVRLSTDEENQESKNEQEVQDESILESEDDGNALVASDNE
ncbi:DASH complex subunit DAD2 [Spathaspora sp. JA1]|nr:DASH complex subunit DAD2 [Spathaspora sp. JA1]